MPEYERQRRWRKATYEVLEGARDGLLFIPLYLPLAVPYALLGRTLGLKPLEITLWSAMVYGGSAQLACLSAMAAGAGFWELMLVTLMANVRHSFVAMGVTPYLPRLGAGLLAVLSFGIATPSAGLLPVRAARGNSILWYTLGTHYCQWGQWVLFSLLGTWLAGLIPASWQGIVKFAVPAAFVGLIVPMVLSDPWPGLAAVVVAATVTLGGLFVMPPQLAAIVAAVSGALAAALVPGRSRDDG